MLNLALRHVHGAKHHPPVYHGWHEAWHIFASVIHFIAHVQGVPAWEAFAETTFLMALGHLCFFWRRSVNRRKAAKDAADIARARKTINKYPNYGGWTKPQPSFEERAKRVKEAKETIAEVKAQQAKKRWWNYL